MIVARGRKGKRELFVARRQEMENGEIDICTEAGTEKKLIAARDRTWEESSCCVEAAREKKIGCCAKTGRKQRIVCRKKLVRSREKTKRGPDENIECCRKNW